MSADQYFIRSRGRVSGPFQMDALQKLARRGSMSRFDEISSDQMGWVPAESMDGVFAAPAPVPSRQAAIQDFSPPPMPSEMPSASRQEVRYFYTQNGVEVGPVTTDVLRSLASSGAIGARDVVWAEGADVAHEAAQIPALANVFSASTGDSYRRSRGRGNANADPKDIQRAVKSSSQTATVVGVIAGALMLTLVNAPIFALGDKFAFWWDAKVTWMVVAGGYCTLCAIALIVLSLTTRELGRAVTCLCLAALAIVVTVAWTIVHANFAGESFGSVMWILSPCAAILTATAARWRATCGSDNFKGVAITFGCLIIAIHFILGITVFISLSDPVLTILPGWVKLLQVFIGLQSLVGIAGGILSIISASPGKESLARTTLLLSMLTIGFAIICVMTLIGGLGSTGNTLARIAFNASESDAAVIAIIMGWIIFAVIRISLVLACFIAVLGISFSEILAHGATSRNTGSHH